MSASDAPPLAGPPPTRKLTTDRLTCDRGQRAGRRPIADPCSGNSGLGDWPGRRRPISPAADMPLHSPSAEMGRRTQAVAEPSPRQP
jgi:hypothetical protein